MCTVLLPPGVNPIVVKYIILYMSYHIILCRVISYIIAYRIIYYISSDGKTSVAGFELVVLGFAFRCLTLCAAGLLHLPEIYGLAQQ
jgi:hypothetical protein